jgi:prepilin-type processing-associated H-X9-DG protein
MNQLPTPSLTIGLIERGMSGGWLPPTYFANQGGYVSKVGNPAGTYNDSPVHYDLNSCGTSLTPPSQYPSPCGDCDFLVGSTGYTSGNICPTMPRYRHNNVCNVLYMDGHAKGLVRGTLDWYANMYVPIPSMGSPIL